MRTVFFTFMLLIASLELLSQTYQVGSTSINFVDPERNNRQINTEIYYPAYEPGTNVPVAAEEFPVLVFGHGFMMVHTAYQYLWLDLVPKGYILAFPTTEGSFLPSHLDLALDMAFIASQMKSENLDQNSLFFGAIAETSAIMGHSMGGGASFLACNGNTETTTMVTFAAANTSPSAIQAAAGVTIPTLLFAGEFDCVTPPPQHQYPLYEATASQQKVIIDIFGGGHCFFADYNLLCSIGEAACSPQPAITRQQQQSVILDFIGLYFDFILKGNEGAGTLFFDSLQNSPRIDYLMQWELLGPASTCETDHINIYPNPFRNNLIIKLPGFNTRADVIIWNATGQKVTEFSMNDKNFAEINTRSWKQGTYLVSIVSPAGTTHMKVIRR